MLESLQAAEAGQNVGAFVTNKIDPAQVQARELLQSRGFRVFWSCMAA